jgi:hypothetical protein
MPNVAKWSEVSRGHYIDIYSPNSQLQLSCVQSSISVASGDSDGLRTALTSLQCCVLSFPACCSQRDEIH